MFRILIAAVLVVVLAGCAGVGAKSETITGSGELVSRSFDLDGFARIDADFAAQVTVTRGDAYSVNVEVDDNVASRLAVSVKGDTLHIRLKNGSYSNHTVKAQVTMPRLTGVTLSASSSLHAELAGEDLALKMNGASVARLTGTAGNVSIESDGASQAMLGELAARDVEVKASSANNIQINASGAVTGRADGASVIIITGSPTTVDVETDGVAQVVRK